MLPRVRLLIPVWGVSYVRQFADLALCTLLADGNLPELGAKTDLEVYLLTGSQYVPEFASSIKRIEKICPVRVVQIDDLLGSSLYGFTLTLAYVRGMNAEGPHVTNTHFVFMNSDFLLAENSLRTLTEQILGGRNCILAPSFRAVAERVEPFLRARKTNGIISVQPRDLVRIALNDLHPTICAKTINQDVLYSYYPNQFYYRIDNHTILARHFLLFMLCIKPQKAMQAANTYCDYGFVPELCPGDDFTVLGDSDDFFMLESQTGAHENEHIGFGKPDIAVAANYLQSFTTREHRLYSSHDIIVHDQDLPPDFQKSREHLISTMDILNNRLAGPVAHAFHPYWSGSVSSWQRDLEAAGHSPAPPELSPLPDRPELQNIYSPFELQRIKRDRRSIKRKIDSFVKEASSSVFLFHDDTFEPFHTDRPDFLRFLPGKDLPVFKETAPMALVCLASPNSCKQIAESLHMELRARLEYLNKFLIIIHGKGEEFSYSSACGYFAGAFARLTLNRTMDARLEVRRVSFLQRLYKKFERSILPQSRIPAFFPTISFFCIGLLEKISDIARPRKHKTANCTAVFIQVEFSGGVSSITSAGLNEKGQHLKNKFETSRDNNPGKNQLGSSIHSALFGSVLKDGLT